jgi:membrane protease YdiL (CAAX protease family)
LKEAVRLLVYLAATVLLGAFLGPILFWIAQWLVIHDILPALAKFDFETFFHRALLIAAAVLLWPLLKSLRLRKIGDLALEPNPKWARDLAAGFVLAATPLLCCGGVLILLHIFSLRIGITGPALVKVIAAAIAVPLIEELFFRGLILGVLLRTGWTWISVFATSALYSILHFLKAPERTSTIVSWTSGFKSIAHSFAQFADPLLIAAGFTTLFLIGWLLADARLRTHSLWLPIGLHSGWIFASQAFNKFAHREMLVLPWLGKNLLVGIIPLLIIGLTWAIMHCWLNRNAVCKN